MNRHSVRWRVLTLIGTGLAVALTCALTTGFFAPVIVAFVVLVTTLGIAHALVEPRLTAAYRSGDA